MRVLIRGAHGRGHAVRRYADVPRLCCGGHVDPVRTGVAGIARPGFRTLVLLTAYT